MTCQANFLIDESQQEQNLALESESFPTEGYEQKKAQTHLDKCEDVKVNRKNFKKWWRHFLSMKKGGENRCPSNKVSKQSIKEHKTNRMIVQPNKKGYMEFTALYMEQEIQAHKGFIWTMKFSPDGQYLASGGEDGVVFQIEESPMQEFHGHAGDVLDLAWSSTNFLVSSSMDKTVRLWQVGCDLHVFHHNSYVTCIQFNPIDDNYFISGSIDGKVRIWGVFKKRVVHWVDVRDIITAICYQPDGNEFVVGSITGTCHFYEASGNNVNLEVKIHIYGRKKTSGNKITSIQFFHDESHKVMITSEDSKLRIFDGADIVRKFKGSQMLASVASTGRHIISVGEDCHVYVWNCNDLCFQTSKHTKSVRSCEHFFCQDVSVAIPWLGQGADINGCGAEGASWSRDSERFSLINWFTIDASCKGPTTWPEEKLPFPDAAVVEDECCTYDQHQLCHNSANNPATLPETWGLVIVAGGWNGTIRTFHNFGLPVRL
ncbi:hypothetical protein PTKIN_Ptkin08bG0103300 [Pterospermum kingtungense]